MPKRSRTHDPLAERPTLDFSKGVRGKHVKRMQEGTNIVLIAPELMETFPDSVNEAVAAPNLREQPIPKILSSPNLQNPDEHRRFAWHTSFRHPL